MFTYDSNLDQEPQTLCNSVVFEPQGHKHSHPKSLKVKLALQLIGLRATLVCLAEGLLQALVRFAQRWDLQSSNRGRLGVQLLYDQEVGCWF